MLYIMMKRTQIYLDKDLWSTLHTHALLEKTTVSDLVRKAARERYM
jgi:Arc/MetJ family transcription regulator